MQRLQADKLRQLSFFIFLIIGGFFLFQELIAYLPALLGAITFSILLSKPMDKLTAHNKVGKATAAGLLMLLTFIIVLVPISLFINILYSKIDYTIQNSNHVIDALKMSIGNIENKYNIEIINPENLKKASTVIAESLPQILGATFNSLVTVIIMYFILYFLLVNKSALEKWLLKYIPLKHENTHLIAKELKTLVTSNALGIPITALLQGVLGVIGYWLLGATDIPFWFVVTCITAIVPMVGSSLAFISISILFFAEGHEFKALFMLLYGFLIMYTLDSVFRIAIQKKMGNVHPLITTFGIILGIKLFGFIGLVFGPIILSMFILLIRIYVNEFEEDENQMN